MIFSIEFSCLNLYHLNAVCLKDSKKEVDEVQKITRGGALSPTYSNLTHVATVISHGLRMKFNKFANRIHSNIRIIKFQIILIAFKKVSKM